MNPDPDHGPRASRLDRLDRVLLGVVVVAALVVRLAHFDHLAVEHFDEGVYVSNLWFGAEDGFRYPYRHLYAPPLVPAVLEWSMIFLGTGTWGTMLPGILFGTATVPLAWWAGREWFGRYAGFTSAALVAFADQHVLFSRTALVDAPLCFFLLLAVWLTWRAYVRDSWRWAVAAGLATGLAWSTKYNGWLPLAIGLAGGLPWVVLARGREPRPRLLRVAGLWTVVAVVAALVWLPVFRDLQPHGGYEAVARAQAGYVVGRSGWPTALRQQMQNVWWTGRGLTGVALLLLAGLLLVRRTPRPGGRRVACVAALLLGGGGVLVLWGGGLLVLLVGVGLAGTWVVNETFRGDSPPDVSAAKWLLTAWFFGLLVATPLYTPYPRLLLPWLLAGWMIAGAGVESLVRELSAREASPERAEERIGPSGLLRIDVGVVGSLGAGLLAWLYFTTGSPAWEDRTGVATAVDSWDPADGHVVLTLAEPAAFHHLRRRGVEAGPAGGLANVLAIRERRDSVELLVGENGRRNSDFAENEPRLAERFEVRDRFPARPSRLVLLNLFTPDELARRPQESDLTLDGYVPRAKPVRR